MDANDDADHEAIVTEYTVQFDETSYDELAPLIATTVAKFTAKTPEAVGDELGAMLDGDALDRLFVHPGGEAQPTGRRLVLSVADCTVTIEPSGTVTVVPR